MKRTDICYLLLYMLTYLHVFIGVRNLIGLDAHEKKEQKREE